MTKYNAGARGAIYLAVASFDGFRIKASNNEILDDASFTDFIVYTLYVYIYTKIYLYTQYAYGYNIVYSNPDQTKILAQLQFGVKRIRWALNTEAQTNRANFLSVRRTR